MIVSVFLDIDFSKMVLVIMLFLLQLFQDCSMFRIFFQESFLLEYFYIVFFRYNVFIRVEIFQESEFIFTFLWDGFDYSYYRIISVFLNAFFREIL